MGARSVDCECGHDDMRDFLRYLVILGIWAFIFYIIGIYACRMIGRLID